MRPSNVEAVLTRALRTVERSLPRDVLRLLRGRCFWRLTPLAPDKDGCPIWGMAADGGRLVVFDPEVIAELADAQEDAALEALVLHELIHAVRQLRGGALPEYEAEEKAVNRKMVEIGFGHDLNRLKRLSGYEEKTNALRNNH